MATQGESSAAIPWHIWVVGGLSLLWYLSGAATIIAAQHATLPSLSAEEAAYYADKPIWLALITDIGLGACLAGALGLLLRKAWAVPAFAIASILIAMQNIYELAIGSSRVYANNGAAIVTTIIMVIVLLNWLYARAMARRGVLR